MPVKGGPMRDSFTLEYDLSPRDFSKASPNSSRDLFSQDFHRRQHHRGYFQDSPHKYRASVDTYTPSDSKSMSYNKKQTLDKNDPTKLAPGSGLVYGGERSDETPSAQLVGPYKQEENYYKQKKQRERDIKRQDWRETTELNENHQPFGRPGAGAPNPAGTKKQKFTETDLAQANLLNLNQNPNSKDFHDQFGRPGAGAPIKTNSGHQKTGLRKDAGIYFQSTEIGPKAIDKFRHRNPPNIQDNINKELQTQVNEMYLRKKEEKLENLRKDLITLQTDPFGKAGAGAPLRSDSGNIRTNRNITLTHDTEVLKRKDKNQQYGQSKRRDPSLEDEYDPWGKGQGQPQLDSLGQPKRYRRGDKDYGPYTEVPSTIQDNTLPLHSRGGGGAPVKTMSGRIRATHATTLAKTATGELSARDPSASQSKFSSDPELAIYHPFGRPGNGAPLTDPAGNLRTAVNGKLNQADSAQLRQKELSKKALSNVLHQQEEEKRMRDKQSIRYETEAPALSLTDKMNEGMVGRPRRDPTTGELTNQHLPLTDVSRQKADKRFVKPEVANTLRTDLDEMVVRREREKEIEKLRDRHADQMHMAAADRTLLGEETGGGAPNRGAPRKANLDNNLWNSPRNVSHSYNKFFDGDPPKTYVKSTIRSNHANNFEVNSSQRLNRQKFAYDLQPPYAGSQA